MQTLYLHSHRWSVGESLPLQLRGALWSRDDDDDDDDDDFN